jgi:hypothetical protein
MKSKTLSVLFLVFGLPVLAFAQNIRMISSTQQSWSGGIAGRYGSNYTFTIEFSQYRGEPVPDTLWIGKHPIVLVPPGYSALEEANTKCTRKNNSVTFEIQARTFFDDYADRYSLPGNEYMKEAKAPMPYKGVALLSYRYKGKQQYYEISRIMTAFPPVNYP